MKIDTTGSRQDSEGSDKESYNTAHEKTPLDDKKKRRLKAKDLPYLPLKIIRENLKELERRFKLHYNRNLIAFQTTRASLRLQRQHLADL